MATADGHLPTHSVSLIMSWRYMADDDSYVLASRSVLHNDVPPNAEFERGEVSQRFSPFPWLIPPLTHTQPPTHTRCCRPASFYQGATSPIKRSARSEFVTTGRTQHTRSSSP